MSAAASAYTYTGVDEGLAKDDRSSPQWVVVVCDGCKKAVLCEPCKGSAVGRWSALFSAVAKAAVVMGMVVASSWAAHKLIDPHKMHIVVSRAPDGTAAPPGSTNVRL